MSLPTMSTCIHMNSHDAAKIKCMLTAQSESGETETPIFILELGGECYGGVTAFLSIEQVEEIGRRCLQAAEDYTRSIVTDRWELAPETTEEAFCEPNVVLTTEDWSNGLPMTAEEVK